MNFIKTLTLLTFVILNSQFTILHAAGKPPAKIDPVNENYVAWEGVTPKNYITGRTIVPSDLRQHVTVVIEFQMEKIDEQMKQLAKHYSLGRCGETMSSWGETTDWMRYDAHTTGILLFCNRSKPTKEDLEKWKKAYKNLPKEVGNITAATIAEVPVYSGVTFEGAPDAGGKYPYVYVMGLEGKEPIFKSALADMKLADLKKAITAAKKDAPQFKPFFGLVSEPQFNKTLAPAVAKAKDITKVEKAILAKVKAAGDEGKENQLLYDGLQQTKSELILRIRMEASAAPYCAIADFHTLSKYWPSAKKEISDFIGKLQQNAEIAGLGAMYTKMREWSNPDTKLKKSDVKKIKAQLEKYKKSLAPLKESKVIAVQNAALLIDGEIDTVISAVEAKVQ